MGHPEPDGGPLLAVPALHKHPARPDLQLALGLLRARSAAAAHRRRSQRLSLYGPLGFGCVNKGESDARSGGVGGAWLLRRVGGRPRSRSRVPSLPEKQRGGWGDGGWGGGGRERGWVGLSREQDFGEGRLVRCAFCPSTTLDPRDATGWGGGGSYWLRLDLVGPYAPALPPRGGGRFVVTRLFGLGSPAGLVTRSSNCLRGGVGIGRGSRAPSRTLYDLLDGFRDGQAMMMSPDFSFNAMETQTLYAHTLTFYKRTYAHPISISIYIV